MRQVDSRYIDRAANIEAVWDYDDEAHYVSVVQNVRSPQGFDVLAQVYIGSDAEAARDAFDHPFARRSTPDIFTSAREEYEAVPI